MSAVSLASIEANLPGPNQPYEFRVSHQMKLELLREPGTETIPETNAQAVAQAVLRFAKAGNMTAVKELLDRTEGAVTQKVEVTDMRMLHAMARVLSRRLEPEDVQLACQEFIQELATG
jgi:hypothetical protein